MEIRHIVQVLAVAEETSFSRAAGRLHISQPALSQSVRALERELGIDLFVRDRRGVTLTAAGEVFVQTGYGVLSNVAGLNSQMRAAAATRTGRIRLGISSFYGTYYLPRLAPLFRRRNPSIRLEIHEAPSDALERLARDAVVDIAMVPFPLAEAELGHEIIHQEKILLAVPRDSPINQRVPPGRAGRLPHIDLATARRDNFIVLKSNRRFRELGMRLCTEAGFEPNIVLETTNWHTVNALVSAGLGVGFVPGVLVDALMPHERPIYYEIGEGVSRPYAVTYQVKAPLSSPAQSLIDVVRDTLS